MRPLRNVSPSRSPWLWLLLTALLLVLGAAAFACLRARYGWEDLFSVVWHLAQQLSRKRLALALLVSGAVAWVALRWRSAPRAAYVALSAYLAGVLADGAVLLWVEHLGISYGPVLLPLALLAGLRFALALGWRVLAWASRRVGLGLAPWPLLHVAAQWLICLVVLDGFAIEPAQLTLSRVAVRDPYDTGARPVRIVQVTDLHLERANDLTRRLVEMVNGLQPDLIVLTGDYLNSSYAYDPQAVSDLRDWLMALHARYGIYATLGNVDPPELERDYFGGLPVTLLEDRWAYLDVDGHRLAIAGLPMRRSRQHGFDIQHDRRALAALVPAKPVDRFSILLYHSPDLAPEAVEAGFNLYAAGHTHGGQIRLPLYGAVVTSSIYGKRYEMGPYREGGTLIYVSRGIGMEGWLVPRMRLFCPPEIVCYDVGGS